MFIYSLPLTNDEIYRDFLGQSTIHQYKGYFKITNKTIDLINEPIIKTTLQPLINKILTKNQIDKEIRRLGINSQSIINTIQQNSFKSDFTVRHPSKKDIGISLNEVERFKSPITF